MASYDDDCYDMKFETWARHHVATSNTLMLDGPLERKVAEFITEVRCVPIRVFVDLSGPNTPEPYDDDHIPHPDEVVTPRTEAKGAFNAIAASYEAVTDFYELRIGETGYVMSGTGVSVPDGMYEHF